jgi:hypothetical protein
VKFPFGDSAQDMEQIDGALHLNGSWFLAELKAESGDIAVAPIAKLRNQLQRRPAGTLGVVFSRKGFTDAARALASFTAPQTILLWSGEDLEYAFKHKYFKKGLLAKQRMAVRNGLSDYSLRLEGPIS